MIKTRVVAMKCELGYVINCCIGAYKETTWKEFLIITAFATLITLFLNWLIGTTYTQIVASMFFCFFLCKMFRDAIVYCKNRPE